MAEALDNRHLLKATICPICSGTSVLIATVKTINPSSNETLDLRECRNCRHWWHDPLPTQEYLSSLYEKASEFVVSKESLEISQESGESAMIATAILSSMAGKDGFNYLEIGVGSGQLFSILKEKAELYYGVEPGNWHKTDENIVKDIDDLPEDVHFDLIVAHNVLEHLCNPIDMMKKLKKVANRGATIHCSFPNRDSIQAAIRNGRWNMVRPVGHLHYFSSDSMERMFEESKWKLLEKRRCRPRSLGFQDLLVALGKGTRDGPFHTTMHLLIDELLLGKDQWNVKGVALDSM